MADVFISYKSEDRAAAKLFADALAAEGVSVWWDPVLRTGETYDEVIERNLREAALVVVLWSPRSVKSKWVRAEATIGERKGGLMPVLIEACERPIAFELTQTADLVGWRGDRGDARWRRFMADLRDALAVRATQVREHTAQPPPDPLTIETLFWSSIKDGVDPADFEAYEQRYPHGNFVDIARRKLRALRAAPSPTALPRPARPRWIMFAAAAVVFAVLVGGFLFVNGQGALPDARTTPARQRVTAGAAASRIEDFSLFRDCEACPEMVALPAGSFSIGSPVSEAEREDDEGEYQRRVTLRRFAIGRFEVTFDEWDACVAAQACETSGQRSENPWGYSVGDDEGWGRGDRPAIWVDWQDAQAYVRWLSSTTGHRYRLPSESEWEYAARAGTMTAHPWGDAQRFAYANGDGTQGVDQWAESTAPVGQFRANAFGLYDMHGNVAEWVQDCLGFYRELPTNGAAYERDGCLDRRVRGGAWWAGDRMLRSADRQQAQIVIPLSTGVPVPNMPANDIGFRVARDL